jgi:hypothetical protein
VVEVDDHSLRVRKSGKVSDEVFFRFAHACLIRLPQSEQSAEGIVDSVFSALRSNEDFGRLGQLREARKVVEILAEDLQRVRSSLAIARYYGYASCGYFPPNISCKGRFLRKRIAKEDSLPGFALTNQFPTNREGYACSWDERDASVDNLVIPSEGVNSLMMDLVKGKVFGYKLLYLYSGKALLLWDIAGLFVSGIVVAACEAARGAPAVGAVAKGVCTVGTWLFGTATVFLFTKGVLYDLEHWLGPNKKFMRTLREIFTLSPRSF